MPQIMPLLADATDVALIAICVIVLFGFFALVIFMVWRVLRGPPPGNQDSNARHRAEQGKPRERERYHSWEEFRQDLTSLTQQLGEERAQRDQSVRENEFLARMYRVRWEPIQLPSKIRISWKLDTDTLSAGLSLFTSGFGALADFRLLGFRKTGDGFNPQPLTGDGNGTCIVSAKSASEGSIEDRLQEGHTYFYTFYLESTKRGEDGQPKRWDAVQFSVSPPFDMQGVGAGRAAEERVINETFAPLGDIDAVERGRKEHHAKYPSGHPIHDLIDRLADARIMEILERRK